MRDALFQIDSNKILGFQSFHSHVQVKSSKVKEKENGRKSDY